MSFMFRSLPCFLNSDVWVISMNNSMESFFHGKSYGKTVLKGREESFRRQELHGLQRVNLYKWNLVILLGALPGKGALFGKLDFNMRQNCQLFSRDNRLK